MGSDPTLFEKVLHNIHMARQSRVDVGDVVYHAINRSNNRVPIFKTDSDYQNFEYLLSEIHKEHGMRILAYTIMPNHWHLLLYPRKDGDMSKALQWLGTTHACRFRTRSQTIGHGHLYQGRYKSFVVGTDNHLLTVLKYIERNPVRAKLAKKAQDWKWGSAYRRVHGTGKQKELLSELPVELPENYLDWVNYAEPAEELKNLRASVNTGQQYIASNLEY
jgi:putative transposase